PLISGNAKHLPARDPQHPPYFNKNQCNTKATSHPLAVLLDSSIEDERKRDSGCQHQQDGINQSGNAERTWSSHTLLEVLDIGAERSKNHGARNVDSPRHTMKFCEALAQPIRELQRP